MEMTVPEVLSNAEDLMDGSPLRANMVPSSAPHPPRPQESDTEAATLGSVYHVDKESGRREHLYVSVGLLDLHPPKRAALLKICYFLHYCELRARWPPP